MTGVENPAETKSFFKKAFAERRRITLARDVDVKSMKGNGWYEAKNKNGVIGRDRETGKVVMLSMGGARNPIRKYTGVFK